MSSHDLAGEQVGLDDLSDGDRVHLEYRDLDSTPASLDGRVVETRDGGYPTRHRVWITIETETERRVRVMFGGGVLDPEHAIQLGYRARFHKRGDGA